MTDQNNGDRLGFDSFFGEPPLLKGEDKTHSLKVLTAVTQHFEPEDIVDLMMVNDVTNKYLEEARFRRISSQLIEGAKPEALEILLGLLCPAMAYINESPSDVARCYFSGDSKTKEEAALRVASYGITEEMIEAKATQLVIGPLLALDRMSANREKSRRILRKDHELRRKEREQPRAVSHNADDRASHSPKKAAA